MIKRNTVEIISEEELKELLKKDEKSAYIGFEPSGKIHLGHYLQIKKMIDLQNAGFDITILLADLHAYLNQKGELDEIKEIGDYNKRVFEAMGLKAKGSGTTANLVTLESVDIEAVRSVAKNLQFTPPSA